MKIMKSYYLLHMLHMGSEHIDFSELLHLSFIHILLWPPSQEKWALSGLSL